MLKDELEAIINSDNGWSARSTLILAIGILGEYAALPVFENAKTSLIGKLFKSRKPTELKHVLHWWQKKLKIVFALMVVGGVVGEYEFSSRIARNADRLQQISDQELAEANQNAANATDRSIRSESNLAATNLRLAEEARKRREAESQIATAQAAAAEARSMAASADLARAELEARISPRTLTVEQRAYVSRRLSPFARQFFGRRVKLDWSLTDPESTIFAIELEDSLKRAGIEVLRPTVINLGGDIKIGFGVVGGPRDGGFITQLYSILHVDFPRESAMYEVSDKNDGFPVTVTIGVKTPLGLDTLPAATVPQGVPAAPVDRRLTVEQMSTVLRELSPFIGQRIIFVLPPGDREVFGIATQIDLVLGVARWIRSPGRPPPNIGRLRGILIEVGNPATDRDKNAADWLASALREAHLNVIGPLRSNGLTVAPITISFGSNR